MKLLEIQAAIGTAILLLSSPCDAKHSHSLQHLDIFSKRHNHKRIHASPRVEGIESGLQKRGDCTFPTNVGLVPVTPNQQNAGWAMSPDQPCKRNGWCPYACPPGQVMAQWNPQATSYTYPMSMDGGLFCDANGNIQKPFPNKPYCVDGTGALGAKNNCKGGVAFCQTVLPGNEAMLIPTNVESWSVLAVPDTSYWASTAAHFYINPPGTSTEEGCIWGDGSSAIGNWAPYVAGANTDGNGNTFTKIGWNPIWTGCSLSGTPPTFGVKIECNGGGCNGLPCSIDPSVNGVGGVTSSDQASGAGGANFCVVTVPKGSTANVVVFPAGNSNGGGSNNGGSGSGQSSPPSSSAPKPTPTPSPSSNPTPTPSPSSSSPPPSTSSTSSVGSSSESSSPSSSLAPSSSSSSLLPYPTADNAPHILFQNATSTSGPTAVAASGTGASTGILASPSPIASQEASKKNAAPGGFVSSSFFSFSIAFVAAALML